MRFNKAELLTLASQPAHKYEKEGLLQIREKVESFFRRGETFTERWFRLCGNLLFYLRTSDHWSEPMGVIVLENFSLHIDTETKGKGFHFTIGYQTGGSFTISASSESERASWIDAISSASFTALRAKVEWMRSEIQAKQRGRKSSTSSGTSLSPLKTCGYVSDISESPLCEVSVACDNLKCDAHGRAPSPKVVVHVRNSPNPDAWVKYGATEVASRTSNPVFLTTLSFRGSDGLDERTEVRLTVYDVRERTTGTQALVGSLRLQLGALKSIDRTRLPITNGRGPLKKGAPSVIPSQAGFMTLTCWNLEREERSSTESTPCRPNPARPYENQNNGNTSSSSVQMGGHRRTQSLPPRLGCRLKIPLQNNFGLIFSNPWVQTYRFHSGLGGDIFVHEVMAESRVAFTFPQQLLSLWIAEEKELLQEMIGLGELREPWHSRQVQILERHLWLINVYTQAKQNLVNGAGDLRPSAAKADPTHEFVPLNLHLQRIWAQNESLHKSGFHDTITCGAFTAYAQGYESGGLVKLLKTHKNFPEVGNGHTYKKGSWSPGRLPGINKVAVTYDSVQGIKRLRKEIVERMQVIMRLAKERRTNGMHKFVEEIYHRCRLLLSICDNSLIQESFEFFERQKLSLPNSNAFDQDPEGNDEEFSEEGKISVDEGIDMPNSPMRSVVDLFKKRAAEMGSKDEDRTPDSGLGIDEIVKSFLDSPSSNYYRPREEPEPWDLTQLNIEASVISLNSKVKVLCGQGAEIEHHSLRPASLINRVHSVHDNSQRPLSLREGIHWRKSLREESSYPVKKENNNTLSTPPVQLAATPLCSDWSDELRSSVKKLRLAMDGLLKTSRLAHSIFRLQENNEKSQLGYILKYRRDICFSQALTTLVAGLMGRLWCRKPDPSFLHVLTRLGPLVSFQSFLTAYAQELEMFNDMIVAIEDLKTVEFVLVHGRKEDGQNFLAPKVHGSRTSLKVLLPVPESVLTMVPVGSTSFTVTPVFFNIGINEHATIAERIGNMEPQEKSNMDSFARLNEYYRRYKRLTLPVKFTSKRNQVVEPNVDILLDKMHSELLSKRKKNVEIVHLASQICRSLMGIRFTSCKSGKDRTGMSVTLEQVQILSLEYDLAEHEFQLALDAMRSEGCRRENTLKNIGQRKYAFNALQSFALPKLYRPPQGTFGNVQS